MDESTCIVFLGNPGREYEKTRHNAGRLAGNRLETLIREGRFGPEPGPTPVSWSEKFEARIATIVIQGQRIFLVHPLSYMNLSGTSVRKVAEFHKIPISRILVVHDEIEIPFGFFSFKNGGGAAGHNGLRSIDANLGSGAFFRCRVGVGRPQHGDVASYVLSNFSADEFAALDLIFDAAILKISDWLFRQNWDGRPVQVISDSDQRRMK